MSNRTSRTNGDTDRPTFGAVMLASDTVKATEAGLNVNSSGELELWDRLGNVLRPVGQFYSNVVAGTTVTASSTETVTLFTTIPANSVRAGEVVRIRFGVTTPATNAGDTVIIRLRVGPTTLTGTALLTGAAVDPVNNSFCRGDFELVCRAAPSATSACVGGGVLSNIGTSAAGTAATAQTLAATNFATNGALLVEVTVQFSSTNAGNSAIGDYLIVDVT